MSRSVPGRMIAYQTGLLIGLLAILGGSIFAGATLGSIGPVAGLAVIAALGERVRVTTGERVQTSISLVPTVFAATVFGPLAAMIVAASSLVGEFPPILSDFGRSPQKLDRQPYLRWGIYTCIRSICAGLAGIAAWIVLARLGDNTTAVIVATSAAALTAEALDVLFCVATMTLRNGSGSAVLKALGVPALVAIPLYTPLIAGLAVAYRQLSPWSIALFFLPALAAQRLYGMYQTQRDLNASISQANEQLERANLSFASALVATLDARDRYTAGHSAAVSVYSRDIAERMGLDEVTQRLAHLCGLVHDIGKIGLPAGLLEKPGALTLDERRDMQRHSEIGEGILANVDTYAEIATIVRHHHERVDGHGYPDGIQKDQIPLLARIIAVADAYNAMTSNRPYRDAMPTHVARLRLAQAAESQFDTDVVVAFEAILAQAPEGYRRAQGAEFTWNAATEAREPEARFTEPKAAVPDADAPSSVARGRPAALDRDAPGHPADAAILPAALFA